MAHSLPPGHGADPAPAVLVVEDEALIAMSLAFELEGAGLHVLGPGATLARGLELIRGVRVDAALLDINLGGERSWPIADALLERGVPVLFLSGEERRSLPERLRGIEMVTKPVDPTTLVSRVRAMVASSD